MKQKRWQLWIDGRKYREEDFRKYIKKELIRKIAPTSRLSRIHLDKAFHNLDFANFTLRSQHKINKRLSAETYFDWVIIISYYSMYHSALALLYRIGYKTSTHLATICVLCKECLGKTLKRDEIENLSRAFELRGEDIKEIGRAKQRREKASYSGSISFEKHLAEMTIEDARKFVRRVASILLL